MPVHVPKSGEIFRADERLPAPDPLIRQLAHLMDDGISIGRFSIGLDPLLGLVPGIGDLIGAVIAMVIVVRAVQAGTPRIAVARMMTNIAIDTLVGSIPIVGDAFDFAWKSNTMNLRIYEESLLSGHRQTVRHWGFFLALLAIAFTVIAAVVYSGIILMRAL
jgi:hypothetical protein